MQGTYPVLFLSFAEVKERTFEGARGNICTLIQKQYLRNDTPLQEAYANGYWEELVAFLRPLFGTTFKGNPYLELGRTARADVAGTT